MKSYPEDARLTLAELAEWTLTSPVELARLEALGVVVRGPDGRFPILETTNRLADHWETRVAIIEREQQGGLLH